MKQSRKRRNIFAMLDERVQNALILITGALVISVFGAMSIPSMPRAAESDAQATKTDAAMSTPYQAQYVDTAQFDANTTVPPKTNAMAADYSSLYILDDAPAAIVNPTPLSDELYGYVLDSCERYGVDVALVLGVIEVESDFRPECYGGQCYGLMQIHSVNYSWLRDIGIEPTTYPGNINAGVLMLSQLLGKYDVHRALASYNMGEYGAAKLWRQGVSSTYYSRKVVAAAERWGLVE